MASSKVHRRDEGESGGSFSAAVVFALSRFSTNARCFCSWAKQDDSSKCYVCESMLDEESILLCDGWGCPRECHFYCAGLDSIPDGRFGLHRSALLAVDNDSRGRLDSWYCNACSSAHNFVRSISPTSIPSSCVATVPNNEGSELVLRRYFDLVDRNRKVMGCGRDFLAQSKYSDVLAQRMLRKRCEVFQSDETLQEFFSELRSLSANKVLGCVIRLFCPLNGAIYYGRVVSRRGMDRRATGSASARPDGSVFNGEEFLVKFSEGAQGFRRALVRWLVLEQHEAQVAGDLVWAKPARATKTEVSVRAHHAAQIFHRTRLEVLSTETRRPQQLVFFHSPEDCINVEDVEITSFTNGLEKFKSARTLDSLCFDDALTSAEVAQVASGAALAEAETEERRRVRDVNAESYRLFGEDTTGWLALEPASRRWICASKPDNLEFLTIDQSRLEPSFATRSEDKVVRTLVDDILPLTARTFWDSRRTARVPTLKAQRKIAVGIGSHYGAIPMPTVLQCRSIELGNKSKKLVAASLRSRMKGSLVLGQRRSWSNMGSRGHADKFIQEYAVKERESMQVPEEPELALEVDNKENKWDPGVRDKHSSADEEIAFRARKQDTTSNSERRPSANRDGANGKGAKKVPLNGAASCEDPNVVAIGPSTDERPANARSAQGSATKSSNNGVNQDDMAKLLDVLKAQGLSIRDLTKHLEESGKRQSEKSAGTGEASKASADQTLPVNGAETFQKPSTSAAGEAARAYKGVGFRSLNGTHLDVSDAGESSSSTSRDDRYTSMTADADGDPCAAVQRVSAEAQPNLSAGTEAAISRHSRRLAAHPRPNFYHLGNASRLPSPGPAHLRHLPLTRNPVKGRWTKAEEIRLEAAVEETNQLVPDLLRAFNNHRTAAHKKRWEIVSREYFVSTRTPDQCQTRWERVVQPGLVKGNWSTEEDEAIRECIENGMTKWCEIAKFVPGRVGKQCRERWHNHLSPTLKKGPWTTEEDDLLMKAQADLGNSWTKIAKLIPGRSENDVKNRWNSAFHKRGRKPTVTGPRKKRKYTRRRQLGQPFTPIAAASTGTVDGSEDPDALIPPFVATASTSAPV